MALFTMCDTFGYLPKLLLNKSETLKSPFGGFMTVCIFITIGISIWLFGNDIFYRQQPNLIISTYSDAQPLKTQFTDSNFVITFGLQMPNYNFYVDDTIYTAEFQNIVVGRNSNGTTYTSSRKLELIRCSEKNISLLYNSYFKFLDLNNLLCLKNETFYLEGIFGAEYWNYVFIFLKKCKNSTENGNSCKSSDEIDQRLSGGYFGAFVTDQTVLPANYSLPFQTFGKNIWTTFSAKIFKEIWLYYKKLEISSDLGWITKNYELQDYFSFDMFKEVWDYRDTSDVFLQVGIGMSLNRVVYDRSYIKLQSIAANVGGIAKFLLICGQLINFYFSNIKFKSYLVNYFYDVSSFRNDKTYTKSNNIQFGENFNNSKFTHLNHKRVISANSNFVLNTPSTSKIPRINLTSSLKTHKIRSIELGCIETLKYAVCLRSSFKRKLKIVNLGFDKIQTQLDWINFIKNQNDLEIIRKIILNKEQKNILSLAFLCKDKYSLYVSHDI